MQGFISNMPSLIAARYGHGCGGFINNINKKVTTAQVSMIYYSIITILYRFMSMWWQEDIIVGFYPLLKSSSREAIAG